MRTHSRKLTRQFCERNDLAFFPDDADEARLIQERLADWGIRWDTGGRVGSHVKACVETGMYVLDSTLYHGPYENDNLILCTADQFDKGYLPPARRLLMEQFNKMADRIDGLSSRLAALEQSVGDMHRTLFPTVEDTKPGLKRPAP